MNKFQMLGKKVKGFFGRREADDEYCRTVRMKGAQDIFKSKKAARLLANKRTSSVLILRLAK
jgi:hypothetical protein